MREQASILLIDDHPRIGQLFALLLRDTGFAGMPLVCHLRLDDALETLKSLRPAVIVLDNYLGEYDSFHKPLDRIRKLTTCPVILLTGSDLAELGYADVPEGLAGYISKVCINAGKLNEALNAALSS